MLDHLPRCAINRLVEKGSLTVKFNSLKDYLFVCPYCLLAKQKKILWRHKRKPSTFVKDNVEGPGDLFCIDRLIFALPGLLPRISGNHTRNSISAACIFKDVHSKFTYVNLMTSCNIEQTIDGKHAFENLVATYGVTMKHYHADN